MDSKKTKQKPPHKSSNNIHHTTALAGVAQWIECWPVNQRVPSLIPS